MLKESQSTFKLINTIMVIFIIVIMQNFIASEAKADDQDRLDRLTAIHTDRETVLMDLAQSWAVYSDETADNLLQTFRAATDAQLLEIDYANDIDKVRLILLGADGVDDTALELGDIDRDFVYTPVEPCRIVDTRRTTAGPIPTEGTRSFNVYGSVANQGGNSAGCPSPRGEPRAVHINVVAVKPTGNGTLRAFPYGISPPTASLVNYTTNTTIANGATVQTCYLCGRDITIQSRFASANVVIDVLGYYHDAEPEKVVAADHGWSSTAVYVGTDRSAPTTLISKTVDIPAKGRVILMGEAMWSNNGSESLECAFFENSTTVDIWWWDAGDSDSRIDQHQTRFELTAVTPGTKTYYLKCSRRGGSSAAAYYPKILVQFIREDW